MENSLKDGGGGGPKRSVSEFYRGQVILITGGTGFIGKVLVEKLLRSTSVKRIYLVVRPKPGISPQGRIQTILEEPIFSGHGASTLSKLEVISGNIGAADFGLERSDRERLLAQVNIIFHAASAINFKASLKSSTAINVGGTKRVLELAREMKNVKACVLVSSAFCYHPQDKTGEVVYPSEIKYSDLLRMAETISEADKTATEKIVGDAMTTYILTKRVAEQVSLDFQDIPVSIFRPSIVLSTAEEPIPGWLENKYGPTGILLSTITGFTHTAFARLSAIADLVPVDKAVNCLVSTAWDTANRYQQNKEAPIYNFVSINDAPVTWQSFIQTCLKHARRQPPKNQFWHIFAFVTHYSFLNNMSGFVFHFIPGLILDALLTLLGKKRRILNFHRQIHHLSGMLLNFSRKTWKFDSENVRQLLQQMEPEDKAKFPFNLKGFNWDNYLKDYVEGLIIYLLKEQNKDHKDDKKFMWGNNTITCLGAGLLTWLFCTLTIRSQIIIVQLFILFLFSYKYFSLRLL